MVAQVDCRNVAEVLGYHPEWEVHPVPGAVGVKVYQEVYPNREEAHLEDLVGDHELPLVGEVREVVEALACILIRLLVS